VATATRATGGIRAGVAAAVVALGLLLGGGSASSGGAPASGAAPLVPADTLVFVHLSTDGSRDPTRRAARLADRFPSWPAARDGLIQRLSAPGCPQGAQALRSADEAALALFDAGTGATAGSLVLIDTGRDHPGARDRACGALRLGYVGRFLAIGQPESLRTARALAAGRGRSLADAPDYRRVTGELPEDRVADGWASQAGVRRLLAPQGGVLGAVGVLFDQPTLKGAGFALTAEDREARLVVHSVLDPSRKGRGASGFKPFEPTLDEAVPDGAMAYLGVSGLSGALSRLLTAAGTNARALAPLVGRLDRTLLDAFRGEAAVLLLPAVPAPVLAIVAKADDEAAARRAIARLPANVRRAFATGVFDGKLVVSTSPAGVRAVRDAKRRLVDSDAYRAVTAGHPQEVTSLVFLDFSRLLQLGEQTGLDQSRAYLQVKDDLAKVRAVGAHSSGNATESTAEISLLIP
jgi:hypothetical protein